MNQEEKQLQIVIWQGFGLLAAIGFILIVIFRFGDMQLFITSLFTSDTYSFLEQVITGLFVGFIIAFITLAVLRWRKIELPKNELTDALKRLVSTPTGFIAIVIGAPIAEEFLFRGVLIGLFIDVFPIGLLLVVNAVIFMLIHMPQYRGLPLVHTLIFVFALVLGYMFYLTGSLIAPIMAHAIYNFIVGLSMRKML